jgi:arsenite methyltransferase
MKTSPAARLQNLALSIAARNETGLDLIHQSQGYSLSQYIPEGIVHPGDRVIVVGATDSTVLRTTARATTDQGSILLIESASLDPLQIQANQLEQELGYCNWQFEQTQLYDLSTHSSFASQLLTEQPIENLQDYQQFQHRLNTQRLESPLIPNDSADVVILDLAVNRLPLVQVQSLLSEAFRVLRRGGCLTLLLLLADEPVSSELPTILQQDLCFIPQEPEIMALLTEAGYYGMQYTQRSGLPLKVVSGTEIRFFTAMAYKGKQGICLDQGHAVIYRGPWSEVLDDDGHRYVRGKRVAVCQKTYEILNRVPYQQEFFAVPCYLEVPLEQAPLFDCNTPKLRDPEVTKGKKTVFESGSCCSSPSSDSLSSGCC